MLRKPSWTLWVPETTRKQAANDKNMTRGIKHALRAWRHGGGLISDVWQDGTQANILATIRECETLIRKLLPPDKAMMNQHHCDSER